MKTTLSYKCSTCSETVEMDKNALSASEALATCSVKCIMYCCSRCRQKGSINKRLVQLESECTHANESMLASKQLLDERQLTVDSLQWEHDELNTIKHTFTGSEAFNYLVGQRVEHGGRLHVVRH